MYRVLQQGYRRRRHSVDGAASFQSERSRTCAAEKAGMATNAASAISGRGCCTVDGRVRRSIDERDRSCSSEQDCYTVDNWSCRFLGKRRCRAGSKRGFRASGNTAPSVSTGCNTVDE